MQSMMGNLFILIFGLIIGPGFAEVRETEMFSIAITPKMFNWTYQGMYLFQILKKCILELFFYLQFSFIVFGTCAKIIRR